MSWYGSASASFVMFLVTLIAARVVYGWVYNGSGGSILLVILLHASGTPGQKC
jgi:CAAX protease family protein